jgi:UDP-N-acetylglucosamine 1-carboxyvinyltransferase
MDKIVIKGGNRLTGSVKVSGAKNSSLPILAATLLAPGVSTIKNVPNLRDIGTMLKILSSLGARIKQNDNGEIAVDTSKVNNHVAPYELVSTMRASICVLGPLLARFGKADVSHPGGCVIGLRPIDLHIKGLRKLGARIAIEQGYVLAKAKQLHGTDIFLGGPFGSTVLGTANVMMAATLAKGITTIENAACEPEIVDLAEFLNKMGARILGAGTHMVRIEGVRELKPAEHRIIPDRIEAGTYMIAGAVAGDDVLIKGAIFEHIQALVDKLEEAGVGITKENGAIRIKAAEKLRAIDLTTMPYPGFPSDMQAQMMTLMLAADGISVISERIYPDRFMHVSELLRMGAKIIREGARVIVKGGTALSGAPLMASDLRASAALVLAGLIAEGETEISRVYHLDRGYEQIDEKLSGLGADIHRIKE